MEDARDASLHAAIPVQLIMASAALRRSEAHYRRLIETAGEGVWVLDAHDITTFVNRSLLSMLGYEDFEMIGRSVLDFVDDAARAYVASQLERRRAGDKGHYEIACRRKDGSLMYALVAASPIVGDQQQYEGSLGMITDITDRKRIEAQLRRSHKQLTDVLECMTDGMYTCDREWRFTYINARARELLGMSDADMGQVLWRVRPEAVGTVFDQQYDRVMKERISVVFEAEYDERVWEVHAYPTTEGIAVYFQDITERRVAQDQLAESEMRFRQLAENIREVFWMSDPRKSEILYVSPGYRATWGRPPDELKANPMAFAEAIHPDDRAAVLDWVKDQSQRDLSELEYRIIRPDRSMRWIRDRSFAVKDAAGSVIRIAGIAEDITERKIAEDATARLAAIVHSCEDAIISETLDGVITSWNKAAERLYGFTAGEAIGKNVKALIPGERTEEMLRALRCVARGERLEQIEVSLARKDGSSIDVSISISPIRDSAGRIVGMSKIVRDITVRKRAEALECERAALKESISAMDQVLGVVGHELRTPLAGLRVMSEFLLEEGAKASPDRDRFLKGINDEVIRMAQTVNNLLEAARLNSGCATWNFGPVHLRQTAEEAIAIVRPLIDESRVSLTSSICPPDLSMNGDADAVRRLILNLVSNSRKYTEAGSITVHVSARQTTTERWVEIRVTDTGTGIPPEIARRLGEPFALNSGAVGANHISGTGLGLSICKAIAAAHGGTIQFESTIGEGTRVTVALRADLNEPARDAGVRSQPLIAAA